MKISYVVTALQLPNNNWVAEYRDLTSGTISGGRIQTAERIRLDGFFKRKEEAVERALKYLKERGIEDNVIEVRR